MAITAIEYILIRRLKNENLLPESPSLLELGQSNWYGDISVDDLASDIKTFVKEEKEVARLIVDLKRVCSSDSQDYLFGLADIFWQTFLGSHSYEAIDLHGTDARVHKFDLNEPVPLEDQYDIVCNFGTAEHVFNVYQVFKTVHERAKPGGLMLHGLPFQGWVDHGFYTFQPTFFFDLAIANTYAPIVFLYAEIDPTRIVNIQGRKTLHEMTKNGEIGKNALLYAALRKSSAEEPFKIPMQAYYSQRLDKESAERWKDLR